MAEHLAIHFNIAWTSTMLPSSIDSTVLPSHTSAVTQSSLALLSQAITLSPGILGGCLVLPPVSFLYV